LLTGESGFNPIGQQFPLLFGLLLVALVFLYDLFDKPKII